MWISNPSIGAHMYTIDIVITAGYRNGFQFGF